MRRPLSFLPSKNDAFPVLLLQVSWTGSGPVLWSTASEIVTKVSQGRYSSLQPL
jgi:hypothetical protein